ncbi:ABC transporter substrate-binding protein [Christensenellaceae bacterium OttesenSCG-928-M15]|nr:ABC transporter substrate-binding protein [Christensenellaceae bacterium OttesenSCG-928-M15]
MKQRKTLALLLAIAMLTALIAGCSSNEAPDAGNNAQQPQTGTQQPAGDNNAPATQADDTNEPIRIGFVGPLTGDSAAWGIGQRNAIQIRIDKQNEEGGILGRQLELYVYDNRDDPVESVNVARKLIEQDKVSVILGPNSSACGQAMASVVAENKIPMLCTNTTLESVTVDDNGNARPYVFRAIMISRAYVRSVVDYLYDTVGARTAACLYILSNDNNVVMVEGFEELWKAKGGEIVAIETTASADDVDFRAQLTKFKQLEPDVIFSPFTYKQIILMAQQARELGVTAQFAGCDSWFQVRIPESAGEQVAGCVAIASLDVSNPVLDPIKAEYLAYYGEDQTLKDGGTDPYYGYDAFMMLKQAIEDVGAADSESIRTGLENLKGVQGCVGLLDMDAATHNPTRELAIVTVEKKEDGNYGYATLGTVFNDVITLND